MPRLSKIGAAALAAFGWTGLQTVNASYLVVAGGGGGGGSNSNNGASSGGGGGAGGLLTGTVSLNTTLSYTVLVGAGGTSAPTSNQGTSGSNSQFGTLTAAVGGGGGGRGYSEADPSSGSGLSGGSGGGQGGSTTTTTAVGGLGTSGQGNNGGGNNTNARPGNGGGGSSAVGATAAGNSTPGTGGNGTASSISGSSVTYAGGGGGGAWASGGPASGGTGGGGTGGVNTGGVGGNGTANLGGGGGGGGSANSGSGFVGGNGGSGVVIISYTGAQQFGGGIVTSSGGNTIHTFTTSGTLSPLNRLTVSYLIVAGGGAGGGQVGGGGGAGGYLSGSSLTIDTNSIYAVTVGAGGTGTAFSGNNGSNSSFSMVSTAAVGGGGGGSSNTGTAAGNGGSGGGSGGFGTTIGTGTSGQGFGGGSSAGAPNYPGGGGGGASAVGGNASTTVAGVGGAGTASSISGTSVTYATGGNGGRYNVGSANGTAATANTGNGGGGSSTGSSGAGEVGGAGGSGIVIISYPGSTPQMAGGTVTVAGGNVIHTFTSSGYLSPIVNVNNSLRFRSSASAYLNRTPTVASNRKTWTFSAWIKRGRLSTDQLFWSCSAGSNSNKNELMFNSSDQLRLETIVSGSSSSVTTTQVFRDPSAWYHIVVAVDTTQSTASNRVLMYVNGVQVTAFSATGYPSQNQDLYYNSTNNHLLAAGNQFAGQVYSDLYVTEFNWIDGQALTPNSFGAFNGQGVWQPVRYGGSYGTNGFYLPFNNPSTITASQSVNYLVVAGGGGGGGGINNAGSAGGGAGGYLAGTTTINPALSYAITVGSGGAGSTQNVTGTNGGNSVFSSFTAIGGGGGGSIFASGASGGSGGGASGGNTGLGTGTAGQGNNGGQGVGTVGSARASGGGGGGASAVGGAAANAETGGTGGAGTANSISGTSVTYAGGGGGGGNTTGGAGGSGGGGAGAGVSGANGTAGTANTGGGGGGGSPNTGVSSIGGAGGSGIVIISYSGAQRFTGGIVTSSGGNTIHTFTSSGTLISTIFADNSPNGNNWTPNNISLTSGATYDSMTDVPTLTSATAANYCTLNPIFVGRNSGGGASYGARDGNLLGANFGSGGWGIVGSTMIIPSGGGKYYFECTCGASGQSMSVGVQKANTPFAADYIVGYTGDANGYSYDNSALKWNNGSTSYGSSAGSGDVIGIAVDASSSTSSLEFYKNGVSMGVAFTGITGDLMPALSSTVSNQCAMNFGQRPFAYTPPTGFVALNTFNLPTPTIGATASSQAGKYFGINLWTGNGSTGSRAITGLGFKPDWVWWKNRTTAKWHQVFDSNRGADKALSTNATDAEDASGGYGGEGSVTSFDTDGYTLQGGVGNNENGSAIVGWAWQAGQGTNVTNTNGSITSTVSANTTAGFSIVTWTGNGTAGATVGHGLGVAPSMVIAKRRSAASNWSVSATAIGATKVLFLEQTAAAATDNGPFNSTLPSSTVITLGSSTDTNASGGTFVAYCFAQVAGYSAFGSYTGNGSSDGPFVFTGFRPRYVLIKRTDSAEDWIVMDSARNTFNVANSSLFPNGSFSETTDSNRQEDFLSNGFKIRSSGVWLNASGGTFIYMAFAESPFKYANAR